MPHRLTLLTFVAALLVLSACADPAQQTEQPAAEPEDEQPIDAGSTAYVAELAGREALPGKAIYDTYCASCHDGAVQKAPHRLMVGLMAPEAILSSLTTGLMSEQAGPLSDQERVLVSEYLAGSEMGAELAHPPTCQDRALNFDYNRPPKVNGWGFSASNDRWLSGELAGISKADIGNLQIKWAFAFPGANRARSQPTLVAGAILVGSHNGYVYALDQDTGCMRWRFESAAEVRTGIVVEIWQAGDEQAQPLAYFGDVLGNVYAISAVDGTLAWRVRVDDHPNATITGSPALHDGRLFVPISSLEVSLAANPLYECCTGRGAVIALEAETGNTLWKTYTIEETPVVQSQNRSETDMYGPSGAMVWNTPTIDAARNQLYIGTGENMSSPATLTSDAIFAMDLETGEVKWTFQATANDAWNTACDTPQPDSCPEEDGPDFDFGAGTLLATTPAGRELVVAGQKSGKVWALEPDTGELVWDQRVGRGGIQGGVHFGMAADDKRIYVPISDMPDMREYPNPSRPGLHALEAETGAALWSAAAPDICDGRDFCHPGVSQAITTAAGMVFSGGMDGVMRIHDADSGEVLWQLDTTTTFDTVSGETAQGGSFGGGAGPVVQDGLVVLSSGYGIYLHMPGNLILVLEPVGSD